MDLDYISIDPTGWAVEDGVLKDAPASPWADLKSHGRSGWELGTQLAADRIRALAGGMSPVANMTVQIKLICGHAL